jgi:uncharacterized membrane protein
MTVESSKNLGGIGALLIFIAGIISFFYPSATFIVGIIGVILVLIALNGLGGIYGDRSIFRNALYGFIIVIIGIVVTALAAIAAVLANVSNLRSFIQMIYPSWDGDLASIPNLSGVTPNTTNLDPTEVLSLLGGIIATVLMIGVIVWVIAIISSYFVRRSLKQVSLKSNVGLFGTAGLLLLIGAILIIAFGLGAILMWIAVLILAIAFFQLKPGQPETVPPTPTSV